MVPIKQPSTVIFLRHPVGKKALTQALPTLTMKNRISRRRNPKARQGYKYYKFLKERRERVTVAI